MTELRLPTRCSAWSAALALALVFGVSTMAQAQPVLNPPQVSGPHVSLSWSASPNATSYNLLAGLTPGVWLITHPVGAGLSTVVAAPAPGVYWVAIQAVDGGVNPVSAPVQVVVTSMFVPPAPPANFGAFFDGVTAHFAWAPGAGGGAPSGYVLQATSGGAVVATLPVSGTQLSVPNVPTSQEFVVNLYAVNQGGSSAPATLLVNIPPGGDCSTPPPAAIQTFLFGRYAQFSWPGVPGTTSHLSVAETLGGPPALGVTLPPGVNFYSVRDVPADGRTVYASLSSAFRCGGVTQNPPQAIVLDGGTVPLPRAANPPPGQQLPLPGYGAGIVDQLARERPDLLRASCREHGGNNRFMFETVRRLRQRDTRWGLNWKRGNRGDLSQDIVNYNYGSEPDEGTRNVYIIDMIGGHCGPNPGPNWGDQTRATREAGTIGIWTLIPYIEAGYPIVP